MAEPVIRPYIPGAEQIEREVLSLRNEAKIRAAKCYHGRKCNCHTWVIPADPNTAFWRKGWHSIGKGRAFR